MFIDYSRFDFLNSVVDNIDVISGEFKAVSKTDFFKTFLYHEKPPIYNHVEYWTRDNKLHPDDLGYDIPNGIWASFPLYKIGFPINWYNVKAHFPETLKLLKHTPGLNYVSFMRLDAGAIATAHKHLMKDYIFHVLMHDIDGDGCEFSVESEKTHYKTLK